MNLVEAIIGMFLVLAVMVMGLNFFAVNQTKSFDYKNTILKDAEKINLYNFSQNLLDLSDTSSINSGYVYFSGDNFYISSGFDKNITSYYFECFENSGNLIKINTGYTAKFCKINVGDSFIWNYKLK